MTTKNSIGDLTLGLNNQALAVLQVLSGLEYPRGKEDLRIRTYALYSGREKGFVLEVTRDYRKCLHIFVAENRSSDDIFVWSEDRHDVGLDPPTISQFSEESYANRVEFRYLDISGVVQNILELLEAF